MAAVLDNVVLFEGLPGEDLRRLGERAVVRAFPKDAVLIRYGDVQDSVYIVMRGKVKVFLPDDGTGEVVLDLKGPGQYFGEMMLDEKPASASVVALEPSELAVISRADFKGFLLEHPEVSLQVIRNLIRLARNANESARTREQLRKYVDDLKAAKLQGSGSLRRWIVAKRWALAGLLVLAVLVFYFVDVFLEMLTLPSIFISR